MQAPVLPPLSCNSSQCYWWRAGIKNEGLIKVGDGEGWWRHESILQFLKKLWSCRLIIGYHDCQRSLNGMAVSAKLFTIRQKELASRRKLCSLIVAVDKAAWGMAYILEESTETPGWSKMWPRRATLFSVNKNFKISALGDGIWLSQTQIADALRSYPKNRKTRRGHLGKRKQRGY